jgi:hypothetical protein
MGIHGTLKISENPNYTAIYREANAPDWDQWIKLHYLGTSKAAAPAEDSGSAKVDARETAELVSYKLPVILNKPPHQPHLENFFGAIRGEAKLNCPADEAFKSELAVFKASEAILAKSMVYLQPQEFIV